MKSLARNLLRGGLSQSQGGLLQGGLSRGGLSQGVSCKESLAREERRIVIILYDLSYSILCYLKITLNVPQQQFMYTTEDNYMNYSTFNLFSAVHDTKNKK